MITNHEGFALTCSGLTKSFVKRERKKKGTKKDPKRKRKSKLDVLKGLSLEISRGEIFGIIGPNGSGKSTLVRLLSTLLLPDEGSMSIFGLDVEKDDFAVRRLLNRVSVDAAFFKKLSPYENLIYAARLYDFRKSDVAEKAREILLGLDFPEDKFKEPMEQLSRGQQQKVAIARALLTSPVMLLLDEPTTGLDPKSKRQVQAFVQELRNTHDATVLLTTHDMDEAERICDRIAIMDKGQILVTDTAEGLKERYRVNGTKPTLEDVFLRVAGHNFEPEHMDEVKKKNEDKQEKIKGEEV
ncbi:ABC transporter ATP-binding protein, partial [bacterium]|nr:ABC transporter ATP-binding protein [bacterium]